MQVGVTPTECKAGWITSVRKTCAIWTILVSTHR